jgi:hypothetical protein
MKRLVSMIVYYWARGSRSTIGKKMKIKEMPQDSRPRERFLKFGIENLSDAELLVVKN